MSGSVTITNAYAINVGSGLCNFGGGITGTGSVGALTESWSNLTAPGAALAITIPAADTTTFTQSATTQTGFKWTSTTLTSGTQVSITNTGASALSGTMLTVAYSGTGTMTGNVAAISSTGTHLSGTVSLVAITVSGANSNSAVVAHGLNISVTNTNATSGTNTALLLAASGATTANYVIDMVSGNINSQAALTWSTEANTAAVWVMNDGTNAYLTFNNQTGTDTTVNWKFAVGTAISYASAAGSSHSLISTSAYTITFTGTTGITALNGLMMNIAQPTVTDASAMTTTTASTVYIAGAPIAAGSAVLTNTYALQVAAGITAIATELLYINSSTIANISWKATSGAAFEWLDTGNANAIAMALNTAAVTIAAGYTLSVAATSAVSDARLKPDFREYPASFLEELKRVRVGEYRTFMNPHGKPHVYPTWRISFDARTLPTGARGETEDGYASVLHLDTMAFMTGAMKELQAKVEALETEGRELRDEITVLRSGGGRE